MDKALIGLALAMPGAGQRRHLQLHQPLGGKTDHLAQQIGICALFQQATKAIDLRDDRKTAETLFTLLNMIVDKTVSEPKYIAELYASLPESGIQAIERRDGKV
ncbi:hypothetical protein [Tistrella mobilis]|uniref:Uncharacterized protein n=1 Tax=Tistrella mobilis (strain KA081020-065) TaxID=1110502 RepID=I3TL72_TISMK|nr:hypothetical protein [Tistrella mobilis]AFK53510.1 hypothetical protein TMO_1671 [Tistrella mobilis KA081020-065]